MLFSNKKTIFAIHGLLIIAAFVFMFLSNDIPVLINLNVTTALSVPLIALSMSLGIGIYEDKVGKHKRFKSTILAVFVAGFYFFIISEVFRYGIPTLVHTVLPKTPVEQTYTVASKSDEFIRTSRKLSITCRGGIHLVEFSSWMGEICNFMNRGDWSELDVNQQITLIGKASIIGFTYEGYRFERDY